MRIALRVAKEMMFLGLFMQSSNLLRLFFTCHVG